MKKVVITAIFGIVTLILAGCGESARNTTANTNANIIKPTAAAPTADALLARHWRIQGRFTEGALSDPALPGTVTAIAGHWSAAPESDWRWCGKGSGGRRRAGPEAGLRPHPKGASRDLLPPRPIR